MWQEENEKHIKLEEEVTIEKKEKKLREDNF